MKLESLKDKPATKEDIGKTVYSADGQELKIVDAYEDCCLLCPDGTILIIDDDIEPKWVFWQKPMIISEGDWESKKDSIKCMSNTFDEICDVLGIKPDGDPQKIIEAIEKLIKSVKHNNEMFTSFHNDIVVCLGMDKKLAELDPQNIYNTISELKSKIELNK